MELENRQPIFQRMLLQENKERFLTERAGKGSMPEDEYLEMCRFILSDECDEITRKLIAGDYAWPAPRQVLLRKFGTNRKREVYLYPIEHRLLLKYFMWFLHEYDRLFSSSLYSFRIHENTSGLFKRIRTKSYGSRMWAVKADVHGYINSIDPDILAAKVHQLIDAYDPQAADFMEALCTRGEYYRNGKLVRGSLGAVAGSSVASFFGNVYLLDFDDVMRERGVLYARYCDDICVFVRSEEEALAVRAEIGELLSDVGLRVNEEKTMVLKPGESFDLLGFQIRGKHIDVSDNTLSKARWKLRHKAKKLNTCVRRGKMSREKAVAIFARRVDRYFFGGPEHEDRLTWNRWFFQAITRDDSLHGLDQYVQELMRLVMTGKMGQARYRASYDQIKALGYRTLVNEYWNTMETYAREEAKRQAALAHALAEEKESLEADIAEEQGSPTRARQKGKPPHRGAGAAGLVCK